MKALITSCFKRPVTVTAFFMLVIVMAFVAWLRLPVDLLPDLRYPTLVVWTGYPDVPPERVERGITERIEEAVAGTQGLRRLTSRSMLGGSMVRLDFGWNTNLDLALLDVREQIDRLGDRLPDESDRPVVLRMNPNDRPIMIIALSQSKTSRASGAEMSRAGPSGRTDLVGIKRLGQEVIARRLEQLRDIARVIVTGGFDRRIDVILDPSRMAAHGIRISQISNALNSANMAQPGGSIRRGPFRYSVEISGEFTSITEIANSVIARVGGVPIRLRDVAEVREGVEERRGLVRYDGRETLMLLVERRPDANTVRAAEEVRRAISELDSELDDVDLHVVIDESRFVEEAISGVTQAVMLGGLLAIAVLFVFLRRRRALVAVAVAVPLSLAMTLVFFDLLDVTFNMISLSGLALGVGMLVDNAIVVVENIARLRDEGESMLDAGIRGAGEVSGAITTSTLTTIAVFLPLTFVEGLAGRLFMDQSLAVVSSLISSLLVGLTVVPLIAAYSRSEPEPGGAEKNGADGGQVAPDNRYSSLVLTYERLLTWSLDHRGIVLLMTLFLLISAGFVGWTLPREVIPRTDQGRVGLHLMMPADSDLPLISTRASLLENMLASRQDVDHILADLGERDEARLQLDPRPSYEGDLILISEKRGLAGRISTWLSGQNFPDDLEIGLQPVRTQLEMLLSNEEADIFIDLESDRRKDAEPVYLDLLAALSKRDELSNVRKADEFDVPAYQLHFNREAMARFSVSSSTISDYLEASARGLKATELRSINEDIPIVLRTTGVESIEMLLAQRIPTRSGQMPLGMFVDAEFTLLPASLYRTDQSPVLRILADVAPGSDLKKAISAIDEEVSAVLPLGIRARVGGANEAFRESLRAVFWSLLLSLLLVYLILAAQFESLVQPFVILLTVPLAAAGVALILALAGQTINLMSLTGSVVLVGIVVNDAIVKIDFINQRRREQMPLREAVLSAGRDRVRPIMMTTITTVLGLMPLALGIGQGAELRAPMAIAIVGGLSLATMLTLIVVPVCYTFVARGE